ncbi:MAG: creatininase family protein, partial [Dehalococcoidales bacterium]
MKKVLWQEMLRTEVEQAAQAGAVVIIPVGSIEQHANHLPLNTDINCCFSIAQRAAELADDVPVLVAPPVWTGLSMQHMDHPGTIGLKLHTFIDVLTEVATAIAAQGFKKLFFLNGHGGNAGVINAMRVKLMDEDGIVPSCIAYTYWRLMDKELQSISETDYRIGHAGEIETSLQLYLQPDLVDKEKATWAPGALGNPAKGTYEKGRKLFEAAVNALVTALRL